MSNAVKIGVRLRAARVARNLTLDDVANAANISAAMVSRIERDKASPSVATLVSICSTVGIKVGALFDTPSSQVVRAGEGTEINFGGAGAREFLLSPGAQSQMEVIYSQIGPGGSAGDDLYTLDVEVEFVYVLRGSLKLFLGNDAITLLSGDCATFDGRDPHAWANASQKKKCEVLWVLAPRP